MEEAGVRIHGTTREQPLDRFALERPLLRALPPIAPDLGTWHRVVVHRDCHVQFDRRLYSVPFALVGKRCGCARPIRSSRSTRTIASSPITCAHARWASGSP